MSEPAASADTPLVLVVAATAPELRGAEGLGAGVELLACGVGPVDAGIAVAARLAREPRPHAVLHVGIAGMRRGCGLAIGELVVGNASRYLDSQSRFVTIEVDPDERLVAAVAGAGGIASEPRPISTSADVAGSSPTCEVEAMEGFAVLRAAELADVPAVEVRAVSNEVEEDDRALWRFDDALDALAAALPALVSAVRATSLA